jgi:L-cysteine S-thiosulfotransferase
MILLPLKSFLAFFGLMLAFASFANPIHDQQDARQYFNKLFPQLTLADYAEGVYAIDPVARDSWQAIQEFPPYEPAIEEGEQLFKQAFKNGHHYADCFPNQGIGITQLYPLWDAAKAEVQTLEKAINDCRLKNNEAPLPYQKGDIAKILGYMALTSRGKIIATTIEANDPLALAAYEQGKAYYYKRQGQLNFSCASCHTQNAGKQLRSEILSPMLGHTSHWPAYRLAWGELGTLHRRFIDCLELLRIPLLPAQSTEFRNLEYYLSFMSNGIPLNGPSMRK